MYSDLNMPASDSGIEASMAALLEALDALPAPPEAWASREALPVQFPNATSMAVGASQQTTPPTDRSVDVESIDALMKHYLSAVKEVRRIDGDLPSHTQPQSKDVVASSSSHSNVAPTSPSTTLEEKLSTLMRALNQNNSDTWEGKPTQISFNELVESQRTAFQQLLECGDEEIEISAFSAPSSHAAISASQDAVSLDALVLQYVKELKSAPLPAAASQGVDEKAPTRAVHIRDATDTEQASMQALLDALDEM